MIRLITPTDISACVALIRESFATVAHEFGITKENAPRFTAFAMSEERLRWQYEQGRPMFVYTDRVGNIIGYASLEIKTGGVCELNNLCVSPDRRH